MEMLHKAKEGCLYEESMGCDENCTVLCAMLSLMKLKARYGLSDSNFTELVK